MITRTALELPATCPYCGTIYIGSVIITAETAREYLAKVSDPPELPGAQFCPVCRKRAARADENLSRVLLQALTTPAPGVDGLREVVALSSQLLEQKASEDEAVAALTAKGHPRIAELIPRGQANVIGFIALLVAVATLAESILADLQQLSELLGDPGDNRRSLAKRSLAAFFEEPMRGSRAQERRLWSVWGRAEFEQGLDLWVVAITFEHKEKIDSVLGRPLDVKAGEWHSLLPPVRSASDPKYVLGLVDIATSGLLRVHPIGRHDNEGWFDLRGPLRQPLYLYGPILEHYAGSRSTMMRCTEEKFLARDILLG